MLINDNHFSSAALYNVSEEKDIIIDKSWQTYQIIRLQRIVLLLSLSENV